MSELRRYARQMLLPEVGEEGQRRLASATAALAGAGFVHEIAVAYATRAGVGHTAPGAIDERLAPSFMDVDAARAMVAGSRAALAALRAALGFGASGFGVSGSGAPGDAESPPAPGRASPPTANIK